VCVITKKQGIYEHKNIEKITVKRTVAKASKEVFLDKITFKDQNYTCIISVLDVPDNVSDKLC
jgi:hypothetical protein